jgi:type I restriction enzyme S subunit
MQELLTGKKRLVGFKNSESSCLCASVVKKDAGVVEGGFNTETQRRGGPEFKMTEIGPIPDDWDVKRLGDLCETSSGGTPSRSNLNYYNGDIKWFTTTELQDCNLYDSNEHISSEALKNSSAKIFPRGTLLMAMYGATIGRLGVLRTEAATNQACCAIFCGNLIDTAYTYYYLYYSRSAIIEKGCGAGQPNVSQEIVRSLWLPVPPFPEQRAIAEVLSDMDAEIEALEAKRAKYESIKQGMMQELLTGKTRLKGA